MAWTAKARANRWKKWSDEDYLQKLKSLLVIQENGCWEKQGFRHPEGYGSMYFRGRQYRSHVLMYKLTRGDVPKGMVVMHKCDNPPCCNPDHLRLGTKADNNRDMFAKKRNVYSPDRYKHCAQGHEFTPQNTYVCKQGFRHCRRCALIKGRLAAGWPKDLAESLPPTPKGRRPVGASYQRRIQIERTPKPLSMRGSSPRQRAWRARQKAKRLAMATHP